jgi:hypothetical protein
MGAGNSVQMGGIMGHAESNCYLTRCTNSGVLFYSAKGTPRIGGMIGYLNTLENASFVNCTNNGNILVESNYENGYIYIGGITGYYATPHNSGHVIYHNCINVGNLTHDLGVATSRARIGGILSHCGGTQVDSSQPLSVEVMGCSNSGSITIASGAHSTNCIGGIISYSEKSSCIIKCSDCSNTGSLNAPAATGYVGGILGYSCNESSSFTNCSIGTDTVFHAAEGGRIGLFIGSGYSSSPLNTALTGVIHGGQIVKGSNTTNITAQNYKDYLVGDYFTGTTDGVYFE